MSEPFIVALCERIRDHAARKAPLAIRGGGTKDFYGQAREGEPLDISAYAGIVAYEPKELVVTVRAGTRLSDLEAAL
ncbi:MAG TPA: FAD-binding protein, partial [Usitatibacter sp.]